MTGLILRVKRTGKDGVATYSNCELWRVSEKNPSGVCLFRKEGIENTQFLMAAGEYPAKWTKSPRFSREATAKARKKDPSAAEVEVWTWEIFGVLDGTRKRAGLRVHPVNFAKDLLGCVAFGMGKADINADGVVDLTSSREAHRLFNQACGKDTEMTVVITDP